MGRLALTYKVCGQFGAPRRKWFLLKYLLLATIALAFSNIRANCLVVSIFTLISDQKLFLGHRRRREQWGWNNKICENYVCFWCATPKIKIWINEYFNLNVAYFGAFVSIQLFALRWFRESRLMLDLERLGSVLYRRGCKTDVQCQGKNKHIRIMDFSSIKWTALQTKKLKL